VSAERGWCPCRLFERGILSLSGQQYRSDGHDREDDEEGDEKTDRLSLTTRQDARLPREIEAGRVDLVCFPVVDRYRTLSRWGAQLRAVLQPRTLATASGRD
jgi:hypothetical protein